MKKILFGLVAFFFMCGVAFAGSNVTFTWDANSESDLAGYRLYQSQTSGIYNNPHVAEIPAGTEEVTLNDVSDGTYFWVLTAFDDSGNESGFSNEVTASLDSTAPVPPSNLLIDAIEKIIAGLEDIKAYLIAQAK